MAKTQLVLDAEDLKTLKRVKKDFETLSERLKAAEKVMLEGITLMQVVVVH